MKQAPARLKGYASCLKDSWRILVLVDRDDNNCVELKAKLEEMAAKAGLLTKSAASQEQHFQVINRIAIEELEAWFFGDWASVQAAYPRVSAAISKKAGFRDPDAIGGGTWEALERVLKRAGYFSGGLRKIELARSVAAHMQPNRNSSRSFQVFASAITAILV
ncbi:MAG: DUF4276 family protein [Desulfobulbaceae bacterium]|nr:DUF4276 family protein [Desulfobulbaceae bacterium]